MRLGAERVMSPLQRERPRRFHQQPKLQGPIDPGPFGPPSLGQPTPKQPKGFTWLP